MHLTIRTLLLASALALGATAAADTREGSMNLSRQEGKVVQVEGRVSENPWQHLTKRQPDKSAIYFDLDDGDQLVAYVSEPPRCPGRIRLTGTVLRVEGGSKRPGSKERHVEYQLDVSGAECLGAPGVGELVERLATTRDEALRGDLERAIVAAGAEAIPLLVDRVGDPRVVGTRVRMANEAELRDAPEGVDTPPPELEEEPIRLGALCESLLRRILTPPGYVPPVSPDFEPRTLDPDACRFRVEDWRAWWARNRDKPLAQLHAEIAPVLDRYHRERGVVQTLP